MESIRISLYGKKETKGKYDFNEQASLYEDEILSHKSIPNECIDLIIEIISIKELFSKPGIEIFLVKIYSEIDRLAVDQKNEILVAANNHYHEYESLDFCWVLCDLIARQYSQSKSIKFFREVFDTASSQGKEGVALGLDILYRKSKHDPILKNEISEILKA